MVPLFGLSQTMNFKSCPMTLNMFQIEQASFLPIQMNHLVVRNWGLSLYNLQLFQGCSGNITALVSTFMTELITTNGDQTGTKILAGKLKSTLTVL